jgi:ABC-type polysaccharide/polyol phosphate transport system ATPase subunit
VSAVEVRNLSKNYPLSDTLRTSFRRLFAPGNVRADDGLWALRDVSFSVKRGEAFGIIGTNGSGKSTLLQIIAGILRPTTGSFHVNGRLSALLELGSGFSPEFTGRDNVYLNASILGLSRAEIQARFDVIERFAEIGDFIDRPVKTYSTGMVLRLAFAVAAHVDPEILIVDEALAVGDIAFRQRCMRRIHDLRARGTTILFVSHESTDVKALCERCLWLHNGVVRALGEADDVVARYLIATLQREISHVPEETGTSPQPDPAPAAFDSFDAFENRRRYGDGRATIVDASLVATPGQSPNTWHPHDRIVLRFSFRINGYIPSGIVGFLVRNAKGENIFGSNTARENYPLPPMAPGDAHTVEFHWTAPELAPGHYYISIAVSDGNIEDFKVCDYIEDALAVDAIGMGAPSAGYFHLACAAVAVHRHSSR